MESSPLGTSTEPKDKRAISHINHSILFSENIATFFEANPLISKAFAIAFILSYNSLYVIVILSPLLSLYL